MRSSILARAGVVLTASALALSLGVSTAQADDTQTAYGTAAEPVTGTARTGTFAEPSAARVAAGTPADVTTFSMSSGILFRKGLNGFCGKVTIQAPSGKSITSMKTAVQVNGKNKSVVDLYEGPAKTVPDNPSTPADDPIICGGVDLPNTVGAGKVVLGPSTFTYSDGTTSVAPKKSNAFYARALVNSTAEFPLAIKRVNSKISFTAKAVKLFIPATGTYKSLGSIKLQYLKSGSWRTKKTIKLNSAGNGSYSYKTSSKYRYRILSAQTLTRTDFRTVQSGKI